MYYIIVRRKRLTITLKVERRNMEEKMTDKQFEKILKMVAMILDGCKDLDEAKEKVAELLEKEKPAE